MKNGQIEQPEAEKIQTEKIQVANTYKFFANRDCKYFPCHANMEGRDFNCLFCYCPMNPYPDCPGNPVFRENREGRTFKDCTGCSFPHIPENYEAVVAFLKKKMYEKEDV